MPEWILLKSLLKYFSWSIVLFFNLSQAVILFMKEFPTTNRNKLIDKDGKEPLEINWEDSFYILD